MTRWIGTASLAAALTLSTAISPIAAASAAEQKATTSGTTDVSAHRNDRHHHYHYVYHPYYPYRYGRPYYYSPGPLLLLPAPPGWDSW